MPLPTLHEPSGLRLADIKQIASMARSVVGISIDERKTDFLTGRLGRRLIANGLETYAEYCSLLQANPVERVHFAEALTTHTTNFFRENSQYEWLKDEGLPTFAAPGRVGGRDLVIWSAACSTGQEGYSALMVVQQGRDHGSWQLMPRLIGTDISRPVIKRAETAIYGKQEIESIPPEVRRRFLMSSKTAEGIYRIVPELRSRASWRRANLATGEGLDSIKADIVFLRNVLIYFDDEIRARVIENVMSRLRHGGILMMGHTETLRTRPDGLEVVRPSIYRKVAL
ncbi:CheR family methyltransferase [Palleronia marisminoris]|nr:protein-glutamate O-methyltransferase CheR [Palleronia marisminoris]